MLQHYFHHSYQFGATRRNIHPIRIATTKTQSQQSQNFVCLSNANSIEIYKLSNQTAHFFLKKQFFCNIRKLQIIPSIHHDTDFIFILDNLGRFSFWRPGESQTETCNVIQTQNTSKRFYREELSPQDEDQFSGSAFWFDVKDTVGHLFFTIQNKITLLSISVNAKEGLKIQASRTYEIPYTRFRFVNILRLPSPKQGEIHIGIIQELEEKTILKVHALNIHHQGTLIDEESLSYKLQKTNLLSFSSGEDDEIIVLTYDEISLYKYKQSNYFCNYRTRGNYGSVCYIPTASSVKDATYLHLGFDMTVFTKDKLQNYGPLKIGDKSILQDCGILQSNFFGCTPEKQVILGFITSFNDVYFVVLSENRWKLIREIPSLSSIFSLNELNRSENDNSLIVVHAAEEKSSKVTLVETVNPSIMEVEQMVSEKMIESIDLVEEGESLIISCDGQSCLLSWDQTSKRWVEHFNFNKSKEQILACTGIHVVMTSGVYKYGVNGSNELEMTQLMKEENILSAVTNKDYMGYYTSEGSFKYFEIKSNTVSRVRKNCTEEYVWHMMGGKNVLVSAAYNEPGELRILPIQSVASKIQLQSKEMVASISSIWYGGKGQSQQMQDEGKEEWNTDVIVGFHNGDLEVFSLDQNKTVGRFHLGSEMVNITNYRNSSVIAYTRSKQYILSRSLSRKSGEISKGKSGGFCKVEYKVNQVEFSNDNKELIKLLYLPKFDKFLTLLCKESQSQGTVVQIKSLKLNKKLSDFELMLELKSAISCQQIFRTDFEEGVPFVQMHGDFAYIAIPENILKYCLKSKQLVKRQMHLVKEIIGLQSLQAGIVMTGIDLMDSASIVLFDFQDLNIKSTHKMPNSHPSSIKGFKQSKNINKFLIHHDTYLTLFQVEPTNLITPLKTINTKTSSSSLDLNEDYNKIMLTDQYRYLSVWDYDLQVVSHDFVPVSKYFGSYAINDCCWLDGSVVTGDRGGNLAILEFNLGNPHDLHKINMTKVGEIYVGEQIFTLKRVQKTTENSQQKTSVNQNHHPAQPQRSIAYYGTCSGSIGIIKTITQKQFQLLKQVELDAIRYTDLKQQFSYEQWRKRIPQNDKAIDSQLVKYYLEEMKTKLKINQEDFFNQVTSIYKNIVAETK